MNNNTVSAINLTAAQNEAFLEEIQEATVNVLNTPFSTEDDVASAIEDVIHEFLGELLTDESIEKLTEVLLVEALSCVSIDVYFEVSSNIVDTIKAI